MSIESCYKKFNHTIHESRQELSRNIEKIIKERADKVKRENDMCDYIKLETEVDIRGNDFEKFINGFDKIKFPTKAERYYDPVGRIFFPPFKLPNKKWIYSGKYELNYRHNKTTTIFLDNYMNIYFPDEKVYVLYNHNALSFWSIFNCNAIDNFEKLLNSNFMKFSESRYNNFNYIEKNISRQDISLVLSYIWERGVKSLCNEVVKMNQFVSTLYENHIQNVRSAYIAGVRSVNEDRIKDAQKDADYFTGVYGTDEEAEERFMDRIMSIKNDLKNLDSIKENKNLKKELETIKASIRDILGQ